MRFPIFSSFGLFLFLSIASPSIAKPFWLSCDGIDGNYNQVKDLHVINLDPDKDFYTIYDRNHKNNQEIAYSGRAVFMPTHINFEVRKSNLIKDIFSINRSSLEFTRELRMFFGDGYMGDGWSKQKEPSRGTCRIIKNPVKGNQI